MVDLTHDHSNSLLPSTAIASATVPASNIHVKMDTSLAESSVDVPLLNEADHKAILAKRMIGEGQKGSKVEAICKYIKYMHRSDYHSTASQNGIIVFLFLAVTYSFFLFCSFLSRDPTVKVLVFSQYHRMLDMVRSSLTANGLTAIHLSGTPQQRARQIDRFQTDPTLTVFLLSLRTDNSGLTLVDARAVFLMEPSLNPSIEAQAINRIHRIGQKRETQVFKFIMRNSVEQAIDELTIQQVGDSQQSNRNDIIPTGAEALERKGKEVRLIH